MQSLCIVRDGAVHILPGVFCLEKYLFVFRVMLDYSCIMGELLLGCRTDGWLLFFSGVAEASSYERISPIGFMKMISC